MTVTIDRRQRRKTRISSKFSGTSEKPRISVYRSNKYIYAQAIDDQARKTIASCSSLVIKKQSDYKKNKKTEESKEIGRQLGILLKEKKVTKAVFDRGMYVYLGRVQALCDGLREAGIKI